MFEKSIWFLVLCNFCEFLFQFEIRFAVETFSSAVKLQSNFQLVIHVFVFFFVDNFAESDFDYLNNFGSAVGRSSLINRDSVLLKFDPLLSRPVAVKKRFSVTKEEVDDYVADFALKIPVKEERENSFEADESRKSLTKEHEMSVEIMKDYNNVGENKSQEESYKESCKAR